MFVFLRAGYSGLSLETKKELCSESYRIVSALSTWTSNAKIRVLEGLDKAIKLFPAIKQDIEGSRNELQENNPLVWEPKSVIDYLRSYFGQFYKVKEGKLYLPVLNTPIKEEPTVQPSKPVITQHITSKPKVKAIVEETWWVIQVKGEYRMCRLTFDRGVYWEMVEYQGTRVLNPKYRFPKYDNRVVYEFKEHITPPMFADKIKEAVAIRREALLKQARKMLQQFDTVIIARHLTGGTLVGGVEQEDSDKWYLDTYNENGEHIFFGDNRWELAKTSRYSVVEILRRK